MSEAVPPPLDEVLRAYLAGRDAPCPRCAYNLRGCAAQVCPECGVPLSLAIAPAQADRRLVLLLALMLGWVALAASVETYRAQALARREAYSTGWIQFQTTSTSPILTVPASGQITIQAPTVSMTGPGAQLRASRIMLGGVTPWGPNWAVVRWQSWTHLVVWGVLALLALIALAGLARLRHRATGPRRFLRLAIGLFVAFAGVSLLFRVPLLT